MNFDAIYQAGLVKIKLGTVVNWHVSENSEHQSTSVQLSDTWGPHIKTALISIFYMDNGSNDCM